jgi:hypothetical protein
LFALRQIGSKREARDGGCLGAALQFINGIVDSIQIDCALWGVKSMNGRIELVGKTQKLRLDLRKGWEQQQNWRTEGAKRREQQAVVNDKAKMLLGACMMVKGGGANLRGCGRVREGRDCQNSHENNEGKQCFAHEIL